MSESSISVRCKAQMIAQGFSQIEDAHYSGTFAPPVVKFTSIFVLESIVTNEKLHLYQIDVTTVFLNEDMDEKVYKDQPSGYEQGAPAKVVCKLVKAIYGSK